MKGSETFSNALLALVLSSHTALPGGGGEHGSVNSQLADRTVAVVRQPVPYGHSAYEYTRTPRCIHVESLIHST